MSFRKEKSIPLSLAVAAFMARCGGGSRRAVYAELYRLWREGFLNGRQRSKGCKIRLDRAGFERFLEGYTHEFS